MSCGCLLVLWPLFVHKWRATEPTADYSCYTTCKVSNTLQVHHPVNSTVIRVIYGTLCKELGILCVLYEVIVEITLSLLWISGGYKQKWNYCGSCDDKMKRLLLHLDFEF